jgi:hypothetical protein
MTIANTTVPAPGIDYLSSNDVSRRAGLVADWLIAIGAVGLFASLFLVWSHQFSPALLAVPGARVGLQGVPPDATGWQVYSVADVALAALAAALALCALIGRRRFRTTMVPFVVVGLAFALHALSSPPTNGVRLVNPGTLIPQYAPISPTAGVGETVAVLALAVALAGIALSLISD